MPDYGHDLVFGSFITPANADPAATVDLAVLSEALGLDLVTFQDHPYQPAYLDTWTLLSFVAARTTTVRLSANVTNLPLRPPAVLARSVASLDLLSGGRVELGIGAGGFWDAIEGMGARRLTGGESVRALEEAITVIRQLWDVDARGGARMDGDFYGLRGAKRGPAPAHDVSIWVGAYKPRMLALTGGLADGWLPSLAYQKPGDLAAGNAAIDEAAHHAGRSPSNIRRLLNVNGEFSPTGSGLLRGPADQWAVELADLALDDGFSTFILASDDPEDLRRFAAEVAPAVRELVSAARRSGSAPATHARSVRRPPAGGASSEAEARPPPVTSGPFTLRPTPHDGSRRSSTAAWDESTRPLAPAPDPDPDPDRTYTPDELASGQRLIDVHAFLRAELAEILDLAGQVTAGLTDVGAARSSLNAMTLRQNNWTLGAYTQAYCRTVTTHHLVEGRSMFARLTARSPAVTPVVDRLQEEHTTLHALLDAVDQALVALVTGSDGTDGTDDTDDTEGSDRMAESTGSVDLLSDSLLSHLAYEERELVEPLARAVLV